jgi:hypothetical protein
MWTFGFGYHEDRTLTHGYEATREAAGPPLPRVGGANEGNIDRENALLRRILNALTPKGKCAKCCLIGHTRAGKP